MKPKFKIVLTAITLALIIIMGLITVRRTVKGSNDFDTFYQAGEAVHKHTGIYYSGEYYQVDQKKSPFLYPPFAACFFALWALIPIKIAAFLWNLFNILLFAGTIRIATTLLNTSLKELLGKIKQQRAASVAVLAFSIAVLIDNLTMAQINILIFSACLSGYFLSKNKHEFIGGGMIAFAALLKVTPIFFLFYFILKRSWKTLTGFLIGVLIMTAGIPTLVFGVQDNVLYHRQFLGRTIKPMIVGVMAHFKNEDEHPLKKSAEMFEHNHRGAMLLDKNQSLEAGLTRLLLKDRKKFGYEPQPIYVARRYEKLPVLFGGIPHETLPIFIRILQLSLISLFTFLWLKQLPDNSIGEAAQIGLIFQTMTLFAPWARSHQFVSWLLSYFVLLMIPKNHPARSIAHRLLLISAVLYFFLALPYGKAAATGMWANLTLTAAMSFYLLRASLAPQTKTILAQAP